MIVRAFGILALCFGTVSASAQPSTDIPDHAVVTSAVSALEQGDVEEAGWLISQVETIGVPDKAFATPKLAIAALFGCPAKEVKRTGLGSFPMFHYEWSCANETYVGMVVPDEKGKSVALVDLVPKSVAEAEAKVMRAPPMVPPMNMARRTPMTPEEIEAAKQRRAQEDARRLARATQLAQAVTDGRGDEIAERVSPSARILYAFRNPFLSQNFVEMDGQGAQAFIDQVAYAHEEMGKPKAGSCEKGGYSVLCTWEFPAVGKKLIAFIGVGGAEGDDWKIYSVTFNYATAEKLLEAQQRAAS
uniref:hypothetical protein n=1 Tax=Parerythrobacter lutipelagi TaxID=1964208 RepID=UPI0010F749D4|nr:hypothetical protein [Parerythrobacter lutipelagi]